MASGLRTFESIPFLHAHFARLFAPVQLTVWIGALFLLSVSPSHAAADSRGVDVSIYAAHSNDRINAPTSGTESERTAEGLALGLRLELVPFQRSIRKERADFQWRLYGAAVLSRRAFEVDSASGEVSDEQGAATRLTDADAGEFYIGARLMWYYGARDPATKAGLALRRAAFYLRGEFGGISSQDSIGDLINTTFFGAGIEYGHHPFTGSFLEGGLGRTDLFAADSRSPRVKLRMGIEYTLMKADSIKPDALYPPSSLFVHIRVDADNKNDASDGVRVVAGVRLDALETLEKITGLLGLKD
jgi:hypothetical protein